MKINKIDVATEAYQALLEVYGEAHTKDVLRALVGRSMLSKMLKNVDKHGKTGGDAPPVAPPVAPIFAPLLSAWEGEWTGQSGKGPDPGSATDTGMDN